MIDYLPATAFLDFPLENKEDMDKFCRPSKKGAFPRPDYPLSETEISDGPSNPLIRILVFCHLKCHPRHNLHRLDGRGLEILKAMLAWGNTMRI